MIKIGRKKYIIKSRRRFVCFVFIVLLLIVSAISFITTAAGFNTVLGMTEPRFLEIRIEPGDTLWELAGEYMPRDMDRRKSVYVLCRLNHISASELSPGQIIKIPLDV